MRADDARRGRLTIGPGERQPVLRVGRDGPDKGILLAAVEELDGDRILAAQQRRTDTVHAVDDAHCLAVNQDGRQYYLCRGQALDMVDVLALDPR